VPAYSTRIVGQMRALQVDLRLRGWSGGHGTRQSSGSVLEPDGVGEFEAPELACRAHAPETSSSTLKLPRVACE